MATKPDELTAQELAERLENGDIFDQAAAKMLRRQATAIKDLNEMVANKANNGE